MSTIQAFFFIGIYFFYFISNNNCRLLTTVQGSLFTRDGDWHKLVTDLFNDFVSILLVWVAKLKNAIKLENISNLITSPSSYQCIRRKTRLVHFVIHGRHILMECMCRCEIIVTTECKQTKYRHITYF
jgi:hypothetical protein